jgi:hypothetical protein
MEGLRREMGAAAGVEVLEDAEVRAEMVAAAVAAAVVASPRTLPVLKVDPLHAGCHMPLVGL